MEDIKVSIITVCFNSEKTIERTIKSVLEQTYKNIEYIIVDGASTDNTLGIADRYRKSFGGRLIVISERDDGIYDAMNKGIDMASGELIGIINSDDWYERDAVETVVKNYIKNRECSKAVLYGKTGICQDDTLIRISESSHEKLEEEMISHPACFVTKEAYDKLGKYNTGYSCVADYDLMLRFFRSGEVKFVPINEHISNFSLGGMSSTGKAYIDLMRLKINYKKISWVKGYTEILKAKLAMVMEKHGLKPIRVRKS